MTASARRRSNHGGVTVRFLARLRVITAVTCAVLCPVSVLAQNARPTSVFVFGGVGSITPDDVFTYWKGPTWRAGGGVERRLAGHVLVGGELEILQRPNSPGEQTSILPSVNAGFDVGNGRIRPFVTGGYTFASGSAVFNIGGGVNIWLGERLGGRIEFRDHRFVFDELLDSYGLRVGFTIR